MPHMGATGNYWSQAIATITRVIIYFDFLHSGLSQSTNPIPEKGRQVIADDYIFRKGIT
jgi:hypothetical protein